MKQRHALVVEDDDRIIDQIEDPLFSLGHTYERVASQAEAQEKLEAGSFDYVLLDLQIPSRTGRGGASVEYGMHLLRAIRQTKGPMVMPVIIMTGQSAACVDLVSQLTRLAPNEFISKPFSETGRTLASVIRSVLKSTLEAQVPATHAAVAKQKFTGGTIIYHPGRIEMFGRVITEESRRGNFWTILQCLRQKTPDGRFRGFSGAQLAQQFKGNGASQNTVASCIGDLRQRFLELLAEAGFEAGEEDVVLSGGPGYRFNSSIKIEIAGEVEVCALPGDEPEAGTIVPQSNIPLSDRQFWAIEQLQGGTELERVALEKRFAVTSKTAKRDLAGLVKRGLIVFVRTPKPGHYVLSKR